MTDLNPINLEAAAQALADELAEGAGERDRERRFPHHELGLLRSSGLVPLLVPRSEGGLGATAVELVRVLMTLASGDSNVAQIFLIHNYGVELINRIGAARAVVASYNRRLVDERILVTNAFSEIATRTVADYTVQFSRAGSDWRVNGRKFYCTGSLSGDVVYVVGKTMEEEPEVRIGFIEMDAPGVKVCDDWRAMGQRTTASGTMVFADVAVRDELCFPTAPLISPGSLWGSLGQCMFSAILAGIARAALRDACDYVRTKARPWPHSGVASAKADPHVVHHIGELRTAVRGAEAMVERAARIRMSAEFDRTIESRDRSSVAAAEAKVVATRAALGASRTLFQVCGSGSVLEKYAFDRHWRNARTLSLHDPMDYKVRLVGDYALNSQSPPVSVYT